MRTTFILAAIAAVTVSQVSASEPAIQARCATCNGARLPQQTAYTQNVYPQATYPQAAYPESPNTPNYAAARKAANEAAIAAGYDSNLIAGSVSGGRISSPAAASYGRYKDSNAVYAAPNNVAPNDAIVSSRPNEELLGPILGPLSGVAGSIESSIERSILGKVTSLPASEASKLESSIRARESSILGISLSNGTHASATSTSGAASASGSADESGEEKASEVKVTEETRKEGGGEESGKDDEKKSGAGALLLESGSVVAVALFALGVMFA